MSGRYRPDMAQFDNRHQAPKPQWVSKVKTQEVKKEDLEKKIEDLEQQVAAYEMLLEQLPEVFERKFQQRLQPLKERYQLLAEQINQDHIEPPQRVLPGSSGPDNVVRFPRLRLPKFLQKRQRSA